MDDLLIVGGGPIGATLALLLHDSGLRFRVLDARRPGSSAAPSRTLALSYNARLLFERIEIWQKLDSITPIEAIEVSQKGGFGITTMTAREVDLPALGYVIQYDELQAALDRAMLHAGIAIEHGCRVESVRTSATEAAVDLHVDAPSPASVEVHVDALSPASVQVHVGAPSPAAEFREPIPARATEHWSGDGNRFAKPNDTPRERAQSEPLDGGHRAKLIVVADGTGEAIPGLHRRKIDYRQRALVGNVECDAPRRGVAFERFTHDGPVALLPDTFGYALVWTASPERAALLRFQDARDFLDALQRHFGDRVGRFTAIGERSVFPLSLQFAADVTGPRWVVLGNAAQALHPIAGQGFNLGLRDVWHLAQTIHDAAGADIGAPEVLDTYARARKVDRWAGMLVTHGLVSMFATDSPLASAARGLGLTLLDSIPPLKRALTRAMQNGMR